MTTLLSAAPDALSVQPDAPSARPDAASDDGGPDVRSGPRSGPRVVVRGGLTEGNWAGAEGGAGAGEAPAGGQPQSSVGSMQQGVARVPAHVREAAGAGAAPRLHFRRDAMRNRLFVLIVTCLVAACDLVDSEVEGEPGEELGTSEAFNGSYVWTSYSVLPVFFVPRDWDVGSAEVQAEAESIRSALGEIQGYYAGTLGRSFDLHGLQVVQADSAKEAYGIRWNGRDIYADGVEIVGNVEAAVTEELYRRGFPVPPGQNESGYVVVMFVKGAGGWAGGREFGGANGGWAIVGDFCIDSLNDELAEWQYGWGSGRRLQTGALAHEIGHALSFDHPDAYGQPFDVSVMGNWWDYPAIGFSDEDRRRATDEKVPFFCRRVGLRAASGQYVVAEGGGGREVLANRWERGPWETFTLARVSFGSRIGLQAASGQFLVAEGGGGGEVRADRWAMGGWETFELVPLGGDRHALRAESGQHMVAEWGGGYEVRADRWNVAEWETFHMVCAD